jgi:transposase InsO family protein
VNVYPFIEAEKAQQRNVKRACELLEVSRAAYYAQRPGTPSARQVADAALTEQIRQAHQVSKGRYGAPRIHAALRRAGHHHGRKRVARLLRCAGLRAARRAAGSRPRSLTRRRPPEPTWSAGTSPSTPPRSTPAGVATSPTSRPGKAGCTWPP